MRWTSSYLPLNQSDPGIEHIELSPPPTLKKQLRRHSFRTFAILSVLLTVTLTLYYFDVVSFLNPAPISPPIPPATQNITTTPTDEPSTILPEPEVLEPEPEPIPDTPDGWYFYSHPDTFKSPLLPPNRHRNYSLTRGQRVINRECADLWISRGQVCSGMPDQIAKKVADGDDGRIDVLWTWINGSDPYLAGLRTTAAMTPAPWDTPDEDDRDDEETEDDDEETGDDAEEEDDPEDEEEEEVEEPVAGLAEHHFRDHDELRYSMRSVYQNVPKTLIRKLHLFTSSLPFVSANASDDVSAIRTLGRMGHVPTWLDLSRNDVETPSISILHHWESFKVTENALYGFGFPATNAGAEMWRESILPTFNSLTIESQFPHIDEFKDTILYLNDDYFITRPLNSGDFATPLYGPVFRIQRNWNIGFIDIDGWYDYKADMEGEQPTLELSNWYLNDRFGGRYRSYIKHVARSMDVNILREVNTIWPDVLATSASMRFRARGPQIHIAFLQMYYHIEKHREALIYSFLMLRIDADLDGTISPTEAQTLLDELSGQTDFHGSQIIVRKPYRKATEKSNLLAAGLDAPAETTYLFTSADGYPFVPKSDADHEWAHYAHGTSREMCKLDMSSCFLPGFRDRPIDAQDMFQKWMFADPRCGDCAIIALLGRSGKSGLSAFLPPENDEYGDGEEVDALMEDYDIVGGSASKWWDADFRPSEVIKRNPRAFAVRNIQRYSFVIGDTPMEWLQVKDTSVAGKLEELKDPDGRCALLAINDDVKDGAEMEPTDRLLKDWYNVRWRDVVGWWEKPRGERTSTDWWEKRPLKDGEQRRHRRFGRNHSRV